MSGLVSLIFERAARLEDIEQFAATESPEPVIHEDFSEEDYLAEFDAAYDLVFNALTPFGVCESGGGDGELAMSRYVDPTRSLMVVVRQPSTRLAEVLKAASIALNQITSSPYTIRFQKWPTDVCIAKSGRVIGWNHEEHGELLSMFGFS